MTSVQFDYSTLSTSLCPGELSSTIVYTMEDDITEGTSSDESTTSAVNEPRIALPKDRYNLVYWIFGLLGIGTLLPWNFFITAHDYWMYKFRNVSDHNIFDPTTRTGLQASFTSYLAVATNVPYVVFLMLSTLLSSSVSQFNRVVLSLLAMIATFGGMTAFVKINTDNWQDEFFAVTMNLVVLMGVSSAVLQATVAGIASILPPKYMHSMVLGQAVAGILASLVQIASVMGHCDPLHSAFAYFLFADIVLLVMLLAYLWVRKSAFFQFYLHHCDGNRVLKDIAGANVMPVAMILTVMKKIWPYAVCIILVFWVTIGIFPGLAVLVVSDSFADGSIWAGTLFLPVTCFLLFNCGDFSGRIVGGWLQPSLSAKNHLMFASILRIIFVPLFLLCNAHPRSHLPVVFKNDIYYISFISTLGFTNGLLVTMAMIGGTKFMNPELRETTGIILSAFLGGGLMLGSLSSYVFVRII